MIHASSTMPKGKKRCGFSRHNHNETPAMKGRDRCQRKKRTSPNNTIAVTWAASRHKRAGAKVYPRMFQSVVGRPCITQIIRTEATRQAIDDRIHSKNPALGGRKASGSISGSAQGGLAIIWAGRLKPTERSRRRMALLSHGSA